jgi:hypothetical protein
VGRKDRKRLKTDLKTALRNCAVSDDQIQSLFSWVQVRRDTAWGIHCVLIIIFFVVMALLFSIVAFGWAGPSQKPEARFDILIAILSLALACINFAVSDDRIALNPDEAARKIQKRAIDIEIMALIDELATDGVPNIKKWLILVIAVGVFASATLKYFF